MYKDYQIVIPVGENAILHFKYVFLDPSHLNSVNFINCIVSHSIRI